VARRTFQVVDITEILVHWHAGRSISAVAHSLGVDRNTARKYVTAAVAAGITSGGEPVTPQRWQELIAEWFPQLVTTELRHPRFGEIAPFHELIREQLAVNTVRTIWQRLRDERGLQASVASFRRYIWATMPTGRRPGQVTVRKPDPPPGQEAQLDYGYLGQWCDPATGKARRVWAFVMVLSCSRHLFVRPAAKEARWPAGISASRHARLCGPHAPWPVSASTARLARRTCWPPSCNSGATSTPPARRCCAPAA
jgi:transposase